MAYHSICGFLLLYYPNMIWYFLKNKDHVANTVCSNLAMAVAKIQLKRQTMKPIYYTLAYCFVKFILILIGMTAIGVPPAFALDGQVQIHDPSTIVQCDGKFYTRIFYNTSCLHRKDVESRWFYTALDHSGTDPFQRIDRQCCPKCCSDGVFPRTVQHCSQRC